MISVNTFQPDTASIYSNFQNTQLSKLQKPKTNRTNLLSATQEKSQHPRETINNFLKQHGKNNFTEDVAKQLDQLVEDGFSIPVALIKFGNNVAVIVKGQPTKENCIGGDTRMLAIASQSSDLMKPDESISRKIETNYGRSGDMIINLQYDENTSFSFSIPNNAIGSSSQLTVMMNMGSQIPITDYHIFDSDWSKQPNETLTL